ncbi:hypothetical protein T484DRAFT_1814877 [Baffinella frigidus]|nr:hypothetical protein T484DRAFT_1814877 [Cryptophyta sp. CCMP2293]
MSAGPSLLALLPRGEERNRPKDVDVAALPDRAIGDVDVSALPAREKEVNVSTLRPPAIGDIGGSAPPPRKGARASGEPPPLAADRRVSLPSTLGVRRPADGCAHRRLPTMDADPTGLSKLTTLSKLTALGIRRGTRLLLPALGGRRGDGGGALLLPIFLAR